MKYKGEGVPLVVLAGNEYGTGSSRDWAAKGTYLLGVRAVSPRASSASTAATWSAWAFCRWNCPPGRLAIARALTGEEIFDIPDLTRSDPGGELTFAPRRPTAQRQEFSAKVRIDTPVELEYYRHGGILQAVLRKLAEK